MAQCLPSRGLVISHRMRPCWACPPPHAQCGRVTAHPHHPPRTRTLSCWCRVPCTDTCVCVTFPAALPLPAPCPCGAPLHCACAPLGCRAPAPPSHARFVWCLLSAPLPRRPPPHSYPLYPRSLHFLYCVSCVCALVCTTLTAALVRVWLAPWSRCAVFPLWSTAPITLPPLFKIVLCAVPLYAMSE
jgi:hypothetical protein